MDFIDFAQQQVISPLDMIQHRLVHISATRLQTKTLKSNQEPCDCWATAEPQGNPRLVKVCIW